MRKIIPIFALAKPIALWILLITPPFVIETQAASLTMTATSQIEIKRDENKIILDFKVKNDGDELAKEIAIELPELNESHPMAGELSPTQETKLRVELDLSRIGAKSDGGYVIPYRVLYKDMNLYPFSAPHVVGFSLGAAPSRSLSLEDQEGSVATTIEMKKSAELSLLLRNTSMSEIEVNSVFLFSANELRAQGIIKTPTLLAVDQHSPLNLKIENRSAFPGSEYISVLIIRGQSGGKPFAETFYTRVRILRPSPWSYYVLVGCLIAVAAYFILRGRRHASGQ